MKNINYNRLFNALRSLLVLAVLCCGTITHAQDTFSIDFNANAGILANTGSATSITNAVWNTPLALLMDFNSVALRVTNDATSTSNLTEFALSVGDERFNFANFTGTNELVMPGEDNFDAAAAIMNNPQLAIGAVTNAVTTTNTANPQQVAAGSDNADRIVVSFGNGGIAPGDSAIFEVRFEFDDSIALANRPNSEPALGITNSAFPQYFPSFQRILFDTDLESPIGGFFSDPVDLQNPSDNASAVVTFASGLQTDPSFLTDLNGVAAVAAVDPRHPAPNFVTSTVVPNAIPEPTSIALSLMGLVSLTMSRRRVK